MKSWMVTVCFVGACALTLVLPNPAAAQLIAGGGGSTGLLAPIFAWFGTNMATGIVEVGLLVLAVSLLIMRFFVGALVSIVAGALIFGNAAAITALFPISL